MSRFRVLLTDRAWPNTQIEREILATVDAELIDSPDGSEQTLCSLAGDVDAIATNWARVTENVVAAARRCRVICRMGIGLDNIAIPAATARKIPVTNIPDYCVEEVAEHTWALLLALARNVAFFHARTKAGEYKLQAGPPMHRLQSRTLGLIGLGRIGQAVARRAAGFGMRVIAHTASGSAHGSAVEMRSLDQVLRTADYISLHAPLTPSTRHLLGDAALRMMQPTACLINTSRGGLIDHEALWQALQEQRLAGAALDVFEPEPPDLSMPLFRDERVIVTPHSAFVSVESLNELRTRVARQIVDVLEGRQPPHVNNAEVYG